jgi:hypothetical protein
MILLRKNIFKGCLLSFISSLFAGFKIAHSEPHLRNIFRLISAFLSSEIEVISFVSQRLITSLFKHYIQ